MNSSEFDVWYTEETNDFGEVVGLLNFSDFLIERLKWNIGDEIEFTVDNDRLILKKIKP